VGNGRGRCASWEGAITRIGCPGSWTGTCSRCRRRGSVPPNLPFLPSRSNGPAAPLHDADCRPSCSFPGSTAPSQHLIRGRRGVITRSRVCSIQVGAANPHRSPQLTRLAGVPAHRSRRVAPSPTQLCSTLRPVNPIFSGALLMSATVILPAHRPSELGVAETEAEAEAIRAYATGRRDRRARTWARVSGAHGTPLQTFPTDRIWNIEHTGPRTGRTSERQAGRSCLWGGQGFGAGSDMFQAAAGTCLARMCGGLRRALFSAAFECTDGGELSSAPPQMARNGLWLAEVRRDRGVPS
jgi:hypothetical protein